jgi:hypothetical protein
MTGHISATVTYVVRHEGHIWNVNVLERVHIFNLVHNSDLL